MKGRLEGSSYSVHFSFIAIYPFILIVLRASQGDPKYLHTYHDWTLYEHIKARLLFVSIAR